MTATSLRTLALIALFGLAGCQAIAPTDTADALDRQVMEAISEPSPSVAVTRPARKDFGMQDIGREIAPGITLPTPDLWRDIRAGFQLSHHIEQKRVQQELRWLKDRPEYLAYLAPRLERHLAFIHEQVKLRGIPSEIALLPIVESAVDPYAFSHGGAAGLWQFIPATGKRYGLDRNWWYDGRRDPVASTGAALDYLSDLHRMFDDWYLALAGYNAGEGNVARARKRAHEGATFWELKLPRETSAYVPRLLALAELVANPDRYGVTLPQMGPEIPFEVVATGGQIDLSVVSQVTDIDLDTLYRWNPALNQWSTPPAGPHQLVVPLRPGSDVAGALAAVPADKRLHWLRIKVGQGDTLGQLAVRHHTDVASLQKANNLRGTQIRAGQTLLIPKSPAALANPIAARGKEGSYVVQPGDSLWSISRRHDVSVNQLMKANQVGPQDYLKIGQRLTVPGVAKADSREEVMREVRYGVRKGDSLARIAKKFNVSVRDLVSWNRLSLNDYLQPGQRLKIHVNVSAPVGD